MALGRHFYRGFAVLLAIGLLLFLYHPVSAGAEAASSPAGADAGSDFGGYFASPMVLKAQVGQGGSTSATFTLFNHKSTAVKVTLAVRDFQKKGNQLIYETDVPTGWSVAKWSSFKNDEITLEPNSSQDVTVSIQVPDNAEIGEHAGLISARFAPANASGTVKVAIEILPVLYVTVTNPQGVVANLVRKWDLKQVDIDHFNGGLFRFDVENSGNVHLESRGDITIRNILTGSQQNIAIPDVNFLAGSSKSFSVEWKPANWIGIYKSTFQLSMDGDSRTLGRSAYLFVIPWMQLSLILLGVIVIMGLIRFYFRNLKKRIQRQVKRHIRQETAVQATAEIAATAQLTDKISEMPLPDRRKRSARASRSTGGDKVEGNRVSPLQEKQEQAVQPDPISGTNDPLPFRSRRGKDQQPAPAADGELPLPGRRRRDQPPDDPVSGEEDGALPLRGKGRQARRYSPTDEGGELPPRSSRK